MAVTHVFAVPFAFLLDLADSLGIWFWVIMVGLLIGLVVLLFVMRNRREED